MKYAEYQVWFHAYNNAVSAFSERHGIVVKEVLDFAEMAAERALNKYKEVEVQETPSMPEGFDLQGLVDKVAKNVIKGKR
jgi:hypothetical protein